MGLFENFHGFDVQEERRNGEEIRLIKQVCKKLVKGKDRFKTDAEFRRPVFGLRSGSDLV